MAKSEVARWTVVVIVEADRSLMGMYKMMPSTRLSEIMNIWKDDFDLIGDWAFPSTDADDVYYDDCTTLSMIGESSPRIVTVRAVPVQQSINEIFVYLKSKCYQLFIKPHEKFYDILYELQVGPKCLEYEGAPLNLNDTVREAGLKNNSVMHVHESLCSITVKLSSGVTTVFQLPSDNLVHHLKEKIHLFEIYDFSLKYQGRYLKSEESITQLTRVVEVTTAKFIVNMNGRRICWRTMDTPIPVSEFVSQLAVEGNIDAHQLEAMEFVCIGCQRRMRQTEDDSQQLPVDCCKEKSLTLNATASSDTETNSKRNEKAKYVQGVLEKLVQCQTKDARTATSRLAFKEKKEKFADENLNYDIPIQCIKTLLKRINELEDQIKQLEVALKIKSDAMEEKITCLHNNNVASREEIAKLKEINKKTDDENKRLSEDNRNINEENKKQKGVIKKINEELEEKLGVKLCVVYCPNDFSPASRPEVENRGKWTLKPSFSYITCQVTGIRAGSRPFEEVRSVLQPLFTGRKLRGGNTIVRICQRRGTVADRGVARTTSRDEDEAKMPNLSPYCDVDGEEFSWEEAKPEWLAIPAGGRIFISGGQRRTIMAISSSFP